MLGSVHDAEDALQDALLRAWRGLPDFADCSSLRSRLYSIVTNAALDTARPLARYACQETSPPLPDPADWLEPYPDRALDGWLATSPEALYE